MLETGLIDKWIRKLITEGTRCDSSSVSLGRGYEALQDTAGAFVVLAVGIFAAALALTLELIHRQRSAVAEVLLQLVTCAKAVFENVGLRLF